MKFEIDLPARYKQNFDELTTLSDKKQLLETYASDLVSYINRYKHIIDFPAVDFFVKCRWNGHSLVCANSFPQEDLIPIEWCQYLERLDMKGLADMVNTGVMQFDDIPKDLHEMIQESHQLSLPRDIGKRTGLDLHLHNKGMSLKKQHEVPRMLDLICSLFPHDDQLQVVDVGAGKGYLSLCLCGLKDYNVLALDGNEVQIRGFSKRASSLKVPPHVKVKHAFISNDKFLDDLKESELEIEERILLTGLHTCGDLAIKCLRAFMKTPSCIGIVSLGCCYNSMTEAPDSFPLSVGLTEYFRESDLGFTARTLACQATKKWGKTQSFAQMKNMFFKHLLRSTLQAVLDDHLLIDPNACSEYIVGQLKDRSFVDFPTYFHDAVASLKSKGIIKADYEFDMGRVFGTFNALEVSGSKAVSCLWSLRALFAPAIESLLLIDRILYLLDHCLDQSLLDYIGLYPIFDPSISARNLAIIARKNDSLTGVSAR